MNVECKDYEGKTGAWATARKHAAKFGRMAGIYDFCDGKLLVRLVPDVPGEERRYLRYMVTGDGRIMTP